MDVTMPQLGETVTEGTITRWFKQVGDVVAVDEPLFEVSTDKVDSEVPSPGAGVLTEIVVGEGETVEVGARLAVLGDDAAAASQPSAPSAEPDASAPAPQEATAAPEQPPTPEPERPAPPRAEPPRAEPPRAEPPRAEPPQPEAARPEPRPASSETRAAPAPAGPREPGVTSPIVRRLLTEHGLDAAELRGTGEGGRITRRDVLDAAGRARDEARAAEARPEQPPVEPSGPPPRARTRELRIPFDNIRRRTAQHMVQSKATSAHVYTSVEVDFERVERARQAHRAVWRESEGFSLTYLPFICRAACDAIIEYPNVNASVEGDELVVHQAVHLGIAVDLDFEGLVAPVVRDADGKRLWLLAREVRDLAERARNRRLSPDDVLGGTFTITNPGPFGSYMTLPIINQPQVAILSTDGIAKRPVVVEGPDGDDAIAIHHTGVLALAWDHRAFDGAYASSFLRALKEIIEHRDWEPELA